VIALVARPKVGTRYRDMKHRRSLFSSACPAARALLALGVLGVAACGTPPGTEGHSEDAPGPVSGGSEVDVAGAGDGANTSGDSAGVSVEESNEVSSSLPLGSGVPPVGADTTPRGSGGDGPATGADDTDGAASAGDTGETDGTGSGDSVTDDGSASTGTDGAGQLPDPLPSDVDATPTLQDHVATLAEGEFSTFVLGTGSIYVVDRGAAVLARLPTAGGTVEPISPTLALLPDRLAVDGSNLYASIFLQPGRTELWRVPIDGGGFDAALGGVLLGDVSSVAAMGVNAGGLVSLEQRPTPSTVTRTVSRTDTTAGGVVPLATVNLLFSDFIALDESAAYVVRGGDGVSDVVRVDLASTEVSSLANARQDETLRNLAAAEGVVYFASTKRVGRIPGADGAAGASTLADTPAYRLVANDGQVYFFTASGSSCVNGSELYRVAAAGGAAEHLASEPGCIGSLASDHDGVYWLMADGSRLRALHLP